MCVHDISRMTSCRMTTRNGWSLQTEGLTDMSRLTNEDTYVARLAKVDTDVARLAKVAPDVAHLTNEVTDVAHLIHVSIDDARLIMTKADMTSVDTIARHRTTASAVTGNNVGGRRHEKRRQRRHVSSDSSRSPSPTRRHLRYSESVSLSRAGPQNTHRTIKNNIFLFITALAQTPSLMMINTIVMGTASMETLE